MASTYDNEALRIENEDLRKEIEEIRKDIEDLQRACAAARGRERRGREERRNARGRERRGREERRNASVDVSTCLVSILACLVSILVVFILAVLLDWEMSPTLRRLSVGVASLMIGLLWPRMMAALYASAGEVYASAEEVTTRWSAAAQQDNDGAHSLSLSRAMELLCTCMALYASVGEVYALAEEVYNNR